MNNKQWLNGMLAACYLLISPTHAGQFGQHNTSGYAQPGALSWWSERNNLVPVNHPQYRREQINRPFYTPGRMPAAPPGITQPQQPHYYPASFRQPLSNNNITALKCENLKQLQHADRCIMRSSANLTGLQEQIRYLNSKNPGKRVAGQWADVSNAALLETAKALLAHENGSAPKSFLQSFSLYEIGSQRQADRSYYTGYFTPEVRIQSYPDQEYKYPVYTKPPRGTRLSRNQIDNGALSNQGLEIAWTNDLIDLYFAQIQGSAIARYPNGETRNLNYAGHNNQSHQEISSYLREMGYMNGSLSNASIQRWLHQHPEKMHEVLHQNPRYIFFTLTDNKTRTATGTAIIPGHTVAVDDRYIPMGSVLLAEIPRIDHLGKRTGSEWRMLFAQDRGNAIKGPGRLDLYTGVGQPAEQKTYQLTGLHKTYLLVRKPGWQNSGLPGL
ncbi:MAG: MltA domain-containing protein [Thiolinea sp.]